MPDDEGPTPDFDWRVATFEGARREQLRRWAQLPLEQILLAIEEMQDIAQQLGTTSTGERKHSVQGGSVQESSVGYGKSGVDSEGDKDNQGGHA